VSNVGFVHLALLGFGPALNYAELHQFAPTFGVPLQVPALPQRAGPTATQVLRSAPALELAPLPAIHVAPHADWKGVLTAPAYDQGFGSENLLHYAWTPLAGQFDALLPAAGLSLLWLSSTGHLIHHDERPKHHVARPVFPSHPALYAGALEPSRPLRGPLLAAPAALPSHYEYGRHGF